jgi:nitric oxide reductase activation protein
VAQRYVEVAAVVQPGFTPTEFATWSQHCLQLAHSGWRAWESVAAFLQLSPFLQQRLSADEFWSWAGHGVVLARYSAEVATAFFHAAKPLIQGASATVFASWVAGSHAYLEPPPLMALAAEYFRLSPHIYGHYALSTAMHWGQLGADFARAGVSYGQRFFLLSRTHLDRTSEIDHAPAWTFAQHCLPQAPVIALDYLERYAALCHHLGLASMVKVETILRDVLAPVPDDARTFLQLVGSTLAFMPGTEQLQTLTWCQEIAAVSARGVLDFLHHLTNLQQRLPGPRLQPWVTTGVEVARRNVEAGHAYFALESAAAQDRLQELQSRVTFAHVEPVLRLYTEALLGQRLTLRTTADLPRGLQTVGRDLPTSDGTAIFVPEHVSDFATERDNFAAYKVAILHQVGFYECGTWQFDVTVCIQCVPGLRPYLINTLAHPPGSTEAFAHFFAAFPQPDLARSLFTLLEDARIDAALLRRYKGIRRDLTLIMAQSLSQRPALQNLSLRQALLEGLLQRTLGKEMSDDVPALLRPLLQHLWRRLTPLYAPTATVYDTAAAVVDCYMLLTQISSHAMATAPLDAIAALTDLATQLPEDADTLALTDMFRQAGTGADSMPMLPESAAPAVGTDPVPYRGEVKPELIQKKMRLQELAEALQGLEQGLNPLSPEALQALLKQGDIAIKSLQAGDLTSTSGLFVTNLEGREGFEPDTAAKQATLQQDFEALQAELQQEYGELATQSQTFLYDEWDHIIGDYRRSWCRLTETTLEDEGVAFVEETRQRHAALFAQVSRQFQLLKPDTFQHVKRLVDGEEIDLDSAIEAFVDRRASHTIPEKVYRRRQRRARSVAAVFLLDMSASTDDVVKELAPAGTPPPQVSPPPRLYDFSGFVQDDQAYMPSRVPVVSPPRRRIIDVEKEALVLMAEALEGLGDIYGVYGFSGYGRDQVDFFVIKEFKERYDVRVQGRIAAIKPHRSTRMGPAIRHAIYKFTLQEARVKLLLLLSDGYPQDFDYGKDRKSKEYGIQDTTRALHETRRQGIQTFCLTVDPAGHEYLRAMCPDQQYLVLDDIASLPKELPKVYRSLTT